MNKLTIISLFTLASFYGFAQNDNNTGNAPGNVFNINNPATPVQNQVNNNAPVNDDSPQQFVQGNLNKSVPDNNMDIPQQQQAQNFNSNPGNSNDSKDLSFNMPKMSFGSASGGSSSGKKHSSDFSKKLKKFNRKMSYVFSKKGKSSFRVDNCFAWAK